MIDPDRIRVEPINPLDDRAGFARHWFRVLFETRSGRCFINPREAALIGELNPAWVKRALLNLALQRGRGWLEDELVSSPGLMLFHSDAHYPGFVKGRGERMSAVAESEMPLGVEEAPL